MASSAKRRCLGPSNNYEESTTLPCPRTHVVDFHIATNNVTSLTDLCAKRVAEEFPFQDVEDRLCRVPEPIQKKIVYFAFPRCERDIELYSSFQPSFLTDANNNNNHSASRQPFSQAVNLLEIGGVSDVLQIGFHLSGTVCETQGICLQKRVKQYQVSMTFDRCKITSVSCTCSNRSLLWCHHAVALALYRIRFSHDIPVRIPVSETILKLDKQQLQKVLLQLITKHENFILPSVQSILDDISCAQSDISATDGLPDPTAGACTGAINSWFLDTEHIKLEVTAGLSSGSTGKHINSLFNKIYELCSVHDDNALRLLTLVTDVFMESADVTRRDVVEGSSSREKIHRLLDTLSSLWVSVVLQASTSQRRTICHLLLSWQENPRCPVLSGDYVMPSANAAGGMKERTVFDWAIDALEWDASSSDDDIVRPAAYVEAYRCHGQEEHALALAYDVALRMCEQSAGWSSCTREDCDGVTWLGHTLDPVSSIFDLLFAKGNSQSDDAERYLSVAVKVAMFAMMQHKTLPADKYAQMRICHREEQLIAQLNGLDFEGDLLSTVLVDCSVVFLQRLKNDSCQSNAFPCHTFARFVFSKLISCDPVMAFEVGVSALTLFGSSQRMALSSVQQRCYVLNHLESQQTELSLSLLSACELRPTFTASCQEAVIQNVRSPSQLLKIAKMVDYCCAENAEMPASTVTVMRLAAFKIGLHLVSTSSRSTFTSRTAAVRWLVSCATALGKSAVDCVIDDWSRYFTAKEFVEDVSPLLTSQPTLARMMLPKKHTESMMGKLRRIVIECTIQAPETCALYSLTLCESDAESFDLACQIVNESGHRLKASYLFSIARYLDSKAHPKKALKIATLALKQLDIGSNHDSHPAACDVFWTCALACSQGESELGSVTPILLNTVRDPILLAEIAQRCTNASQIHQGQNEPCLPGTFGFDRDPVKKIVECSHRLFVVGVRRRLESITPKMYGDFVCYLQTAKSSFLTVGNGKEKFGHLLDNILKTQRGKRKLLRMVLDSV